jgi:hypothetical protein
MKKSEFDALIQTEVQKQLRILVPKLVRPLVQEAVAGALAGLLAEGISKGIPTQSRVNSPVKVPQKPEPRMVVEDTGKARESLRRKMSQIQEAPSRINADIFGGGSVGSLLAETANDMRYGGPESESLLDSVDELDGQVDEAVVHALTRDYSALMQRMDEKKLTGR